MLNKSKMKKSVDTRARSRSAEDPKTERGISLRNRFVAKPTILPERRTFRDEKNYIYPSTVGERPAEERKAMPDELTLELIARTPKDPFTSSKARSAEPFAKGEKPLLKEKGLSRNHILANSRIRVMLLKIYENKASPVEARRKALETFFVALCGAKVGAERCEQFIDAWRERDADKANDVIQQAADGAENIRIGDAKINTAVSNEFDPVIVNGRYDERSLKIRDAVIGLGYARLIEHKLMMDSLAVTKDKFTHEDVTSTVLKTSSIHEETGSRTVIDPFATPLHPSKMPTFASPGHRGPKDKPSFRQRSRSFQYLSRSGLFEIRK